MRRFKGSIINSLFTKRMAGSIILTWMVSLYPSCSSQPVRGDLIRQDLIRIKHAQELIPKLYKRSKLKIFEGDLKMSSYIKKYIHDENPELNASELTQTLMKVSFEYGYDPVFLLAIIRTESKFDPNTIGAAGEIGLMQIKPKTAEWICNKRKIPWLGASKMKNPNYNIIIGAHYFHYLKSALDSESLRYINAYNMGINNLQRLPASSHRKLPYFSRVISNYLGIYSALSKYREII